MIALALARRSGTVVASSALCFACACARADEAVSVQSVLEDTKLYFTAPVRWDGEDWAYFGGALLAIAGSHAFDERVRDHFASGPHDGLNGGQDKNSLRDALPTIAIIGGTGFSAAFFRDSDGYRETVSLLEAGLFSSVTIRSPGPRSELPRPASC